jgi:protoheme IX farnesyltransferase
MALVSDHVPEAAELGNGEVADFVALLKPRVMSLVVLSALAGMLAAPGHLHPVIGAVSLLCIAVGAGASGALNMWWDADIDAVMMRTRGRPIPAGRLQPGEALAFGLTLAGGAVMVLGLAANWLAAALLAGTIGFYVVVYTMWLKRWTPQNIVIGGLAGAFPPMIGWAAATGSVSIESAVLVALIFVWTPPHFWALALLRSDDYARAGVPMLPVTDGPAATRTQILLYSIVLAPLGVVPALIGTGGLAYGVVSVFGGALFVALAVRVWRRREGEAATLAAKQLFAFSILYLFVLFAVLIAEHGLGLAW